MMDGSHSARGRAVLNHRYGKQFVKHVLGRVRLHMRLVRTSQPRMTGD